MRTLKRWLLAVIVASLSLYGDRLDEGFANPPNSAKPQAWWHWMHCNVTKEGIKADLEAMAKIGIGGATILDVSDAIPVGDLHTCSPEWFDTVQYALEVADSLGMELSLHNCPGWSSSGGPWVKKENAMKRITHSQTVVEGGKTVSVELAKPPVTLDFYRDIAVLAYPTIAGDDPKSEPPLKMTVTSSLTGQDANGLLQGKRLSFRNRGAGKDFLQVDFAEPTEVTLLQLDCVGASNRSSSADVLVSEDGKEFRTEHRNVQLAGGENTVAFEGLRCRAIKIAFRHINAQGLNATRLTIHRESRVPNLAVKASYGERGSRDWGPKPLSNSIIQLNAIVDVTTKMDATGKLTWEAPAGRWTILRFGYTLTGRRNHPVTQWGSGLECDKMSKEGVKNAWDGMMAPIIAKAGALKGKALKGTLIDSYEVGPQNWTDRYAEEFKRLRGYDCIRLLPIMTGRYIESREFTERYLQDMRRTVADLFAECYANYFGQLAHENGLVFMSEPYGGPFDYLLQGRYADIPMGEFWGGGDTINAGNARLAGNMAQVYGRTYVGTESFTATPENGRWQSYPGRHKAQGDNVFLNGVNRFIFHDYAHQPQDYKGPGMTMGQWGFHFNRHNTLWNDYVGWLQYLARAQFMLQQGIVVSDCLYVASEDAPCSEVYSPALPRGYHGNCIDAQSFRERVKVQADGRIVLPHGLSFPLLVLFQTKQVSPMVLAKAVELVEGGATLLLGARPQMAFGLSGYPACDTEVTRLTQQLWGDLDGKAKTKRKLGRGTVYFGVTPQQIYADMNIGPDFTAKNDGKDLLSVGYLHRQADGAEVYFVANTLRRSVKADLTFRVTGKVAELWDAVTGRCVDAPTVSYEKAFTRIPMTLEQSQSVFVVFRRPLQPATTVTDVVWKSAAKPRIPELVITKAVYQAVAQQEEAGRRDVTKLVQENVKNGVLKQPASNAALGGDPALNQYKELMVKYTIGDQKRTEIVRENAVMTLPKPADAKLVADGAKLVIVKAEYRVEGMGDEVVTTGGSRDVTAILQKNIQNGTLSLPVENGDLGGDPTPMQVKELVVDYTVDGRPFHAKYPEHNVIELPMSGGGAPTVELERNAVNGITVTAWQKGECTLKLSDGTSRNLDFKGLPEPLEVKGPWTVSFPAGWNAPASMEFPELRSYTTFAQEGVKYFSGTATYRKQVDIPAALLGRPVQLDLGTVMVMARVYVNGQYCGLLWNAPYRIEIGDKLKAGANDLEIRVTNRWINRLIGDDFKPDDCRWSGLRAAGGRSLLQIPQWVKEGKPSPTGRLAFTTFKHWTKNDTPVEAGLLGPVVIRAGERR